YKVEWPTKAFKKIMEGSSMIGSDKLKDELLPEGQKKADLLRELERVFENGINKFNDDASEVSSDTEVSSIFDEEEDGETIDNSSISSSDDNSANKESTPNSSAENDEYVETQRNKLIERVKKFLSKLSIEESELEERNRN